MKDMINERLKLLAQAQECMVDVADIMDQWENSQAVLEKSTYDTMNISDQALNLSKEGNKLIARLLFSCEKIAKNPDKAETESMTVLLEEAGSMFHKMLNVNKSANEIAHKLEQEVAYQREIAENMKNSVVTISQSVNQAVACAEFLMAEL